MIAAAKQEGMNAKPRTSPCRHCKCRVDISNARPGDSVRCPNCGETFVIDGRSFAMHSRDPLPIGTVRIMSKGGTRGYRCRMIKIATGKWMRYRRWLWEQHHGPIPPGKVVIPLDGDPLNDDLSNLALGTVADNAAVWAMEHPDEWERLRQRLREATAQHNRLRGQIKRAREWNATQWYPVDLAARTIINAPARKAQRIYDRYGVTPGNWNRRRSHALGWPDLTPLQCTALAVLAEAGGPLPRVELRRRMNEFRALRGWSKVARVGMINSELPALAKMGYIEISQRARNRHSVIRILPGAIEARGPVMPVIVVHGSRLNEEPFRHFTKVHPDGTPIARAQASGMALLAQAIAERQSTEDNP